MHHFQCLTVPVELAAIKFGFSFMVVGIAEILACLIVSKRHTDFGTITHTSHTNISAIPTTMNEKTRVPPGPPSIENDAHGIGKLLLKIQVGEKFLHSEMNIIIE